MEDPFRYLTRLSCHPNLRHNYYYIRVLWDNNLLPALFTVASLGFVKRTKDQRRKDMSSPPLLIYIPPKHNFPKKFYHAQNPFSLHHTWLCQILNVHWSIGRCQFIRIKIQNSNQNNLRRMFCRPHITILVSKYVLAVSSLKNKSTLSLFGNSLWEKYCAEEDPVCPRKVLDNAITNSQDIIKSVGSLPLEPQESQLLSIFLQKF